MKRMAALCPTVREELRGRIRRPRFLALLRTCFVRLCVPSPIAAAAVMSDSQLCRLGENTFHTKRSNTQI